MKRVLWPALIVCAAAGVSLGSSPTVCLEPRAQAEPGARPASGARLAFRVQDPRGSAIPDASVVLGTWSTKHPHRSFRGCEADFGRRVLTDLAGDARLEGLSASASSATLAFGAPGFATQVLNVPVQGDQPRVVTLQPRDDTATPPAGAVRGVVRGPDGQPLRGALVLVTRNRRSERSWTTGWEGTDGFAITGDGGGFVLTTGPKTYALDIRVRAEGLTPTAFQVLKPGPEAQVLRMVRGVAVGGVLVQERKPVEGFRLALGLHRDHNDGALPPMEVTTGPGGVFEFPDVPTGDTYVLYAPLVGDAAALAVRPLEVVIENDATRLSLGEVRTVPTLHLAGRFTTPDGTPVGAGAAWLESFEDARTLRVPLGPDGSFEFTGISPGPWTLIPDLQQPGWFVSAQNRAFPWDGAQWLLGTLEASKTDLQVLLERVQGRQKPRPRIDDLPLRGIEPARIDAQ